MSGKRGGTRKNLTDEQKEMIQQLVDEGVPRKEIAERVGCSLRAVYARSKKQPELVVATGALPTAAILPPLTKEEKETDEKFPQSRSFQRIAAAITDALLPYPEAGAAVVAALKGADL